MAQSADTADVVHIVGGGILGAATAYFLSLRGVPSIVIERTSIAAGASGKAGGFLTSEWGSGPTVQLHRKGFALHEQLAKTLGLESYRHVKTMSAGVRRRMKVARMEKEMEPEWLNGEKVQSEEMIGIASSAQVTPHELTSKLIEASKCTVLINQVVGIRPGWRTEGVTGLMLDDGTVLNAKRVVFTMGPWTPLLDEWLGLNTPMVGIKSSSFSFYPTNKLSTTADADEKDAADVVIHVSPAVLFCEEDDNNCHLEVYPRPDNQVYLCGLGGSPHLTSEEVLSMSADEIQPNMERVKKACDSFQRMTVPWMANSATPEKVESQACLRPCTSDSLPMMGKLTLRHGRMGRRRGDNEKEKEERKKEKTEMEGGEDHENESHATDIYVAAGHNCWGILWGPVCGQAMAELVIDGKSSTLDLTAFDPHRFEWD